MFEAVKKDAILEEIKEIFPKVQLIRRQIHQNPELAFEEFETSALIQKILSDLGIQHQIFAKTGVVAHIGNGERCIALRADIDALPIFEETGLEYASKNDGKMHACGHDMHTSMLLGVASILKKNENKLNGKIKLVFQPAEEKLPGGAKIMIEEGALENPKPEAIFGQHIYPGETTGVISTCEGSLMGAADELYFTIKGKSTHAAQPQLGYDPILAASALTMFLHTTLAKYKDPLDSGVLSITSIQGGFATNVIPDEVKIMGTFRSFNQEWREMMHNIIEEKSREVCSLYGCQCDVFINKGYPPLKNDAKSAKYTERIAKELFGAENFVPFVPKMWAEDFAYYSQIMPAAFWFVGVRPHSDSEMPALHNSKLNPDEEAMINGMAMMASVAFNYFEDMEA